MLFGIAPLVCLRYFAGSAVGVRPQGRETVSIDDDADLGRRKREKERTRESLGAIVSGTCRRDTKRESGRSVVERGGIETGESTSAAAAAAVTMARRLLSEIYGRN